MIEYDGTGFAGFQRQPGKVTVQAVLEETITKLTGERTQIVGSGRTDAGAHALNQVIAFSTRSSLTSHALRGGLNALLPETIAVTEAEEVAYDFHPRHDAISRTYQYLIFNRTVRSPFWHGRALHVSHGLDVPAMDRALRHLLGTHDVRSFVPSAFSGSTVRTVYSAGCVRDGDLVIFHLAASGFLRQMVRSVVGTALRVGAGKLTDSGFKDVIESRSRPLAGETAPAHALYLVGVDYPDRRYSSTARPNAADALVTARAGGIEEKI